MKTMPNNAIQCVHSRKVLEILSAKKRLVAQLRGHHIAFYYATLHSTDFRLLLLILSFYSCSRLQTRIHSSSSFQIESFTFTLSSVQESTHEHAHIHSLSRRSNAIIEVIESPHHVLLINQLEVRHWIGNQLWNACAISLRISYTGFYPS